MIMTHTQQIQLKMELLNKSFQPYLKKYTDTKLDLVIDYPNLASGDMVISIKPNSNGFNKTLVGECIFKFLIQLDKTDLFVKSNKSWVFEMDNEDLPNSVDYKIYKRK
jgi:hypothetical protein